MVNEEQEAGVYKIKLYSSSLVRGIYFYQLRAETFVDTKKMLLLK